MRGGALREEAGPWARGGARDEGKGSKGSRVYKGLSLVLGSRLGSQAPR